MDWRDNLWGKPMVFSTFKSVGLNPADVPNPTISGTSRYITTTVYRHRYPQIKTSYPSVHIKISGCYGRSSPQIGGVVPIRISHCPPPPGLDAPLPFFKMMVGDVLSTSRVASPSYPHEFPMSPWLGLLPCASFALQSATHGWREPGICSRPSPSPARPGHWWTVQVELLNRGQLPKMWCKFWLLEPKSTLKGQMGELDAKHAPKIDMTCHFRDGFNDGPKS